MIWQWEHITGLLWLLLLPAGVLLASLTWTAQEKKWSRAADKGLVGTWRPYRGNPYPTWMILLFCAFAVMIFAYANPQGGKRDTEAYGRNQNVIIALDLSQSMMATDVSPARLERAKILIYDLLQNLQGQRVALVVFAGNAYLHLPLTSDYAAAALFVRNISTDMMPLQGTAIAEAFDRSLVAIQSGGYAGAPSSIILISDGEDHDKGALAMAKKIAQKDITIYTIGAGTSKGGPVPDMESGSVKKDKRGDVVISKLHEPFLRQLAQAGGGSYYRVTSGKSGVRQLAGKINDVASGKAERSVFVVQKEWYQWLLVVALLLLAGSFFVQDKNRKTTSYG